MSNIQDHEDMKERMRLLNDLCKHVTTLSTGTLVLLAGLFEKVFKAPTWKPLALGSVAFFGVCIVVSIFAMFNFSMYSRKTIRTPSDTTLKGAAFFAIALLSFSVGITLFTAFAFLNL